ncbi:MAG: aminopeptidase [Rhodomicrobium sp.]|nr:MAG: aminopeptidase [Rhodomicrobium sp.]
MFQSFENRGGPENTAERIEALRTEMKKRNLDGFILPRSDRYLNEYVPAHDERLLWLTGFSGSAGLAIILAESAALFVDGRYTLQAEGEIDKDIITPIAIMETSPTTWLKQHIKRGSRIGLDPELLSVSAYENYNELLEQASAKLISLKNNPVDQLWQDQPALPNNPITAQPKKYAGRDVEEKISEIQSILQERGADAFVVTAPESVCWLFNIRGSDVSHNPIMLATAIINARAKPALFLESKNLSNRAADNISGSARLLPPENFENELKILGSRFKKVLIDPARTNAAIYQTLRAARAEILRGSDPCALPKARKNEAEISGAKTAHIRDGIAISRFLHWIDISMPEAELDEITAAKKLEEFRKETGALKDISFETISGAGPNGAIVHYRVSQATNRKFLPSELYLVDSGGQYQDGTTDITRTVALGEPTGPMRRHYTMVLKAHINLAVAAFPKGTRGVDLDPLARAPLWQAGLDFNHGTGHGVGSFLSVHEGPQGISRRSMVPLEPGMILSIEPGYYREGAYGIRLENLVLVTEPEEITGGEQAMMRFSPLTLAPFDKKLIDQDLLTKAELKWLNGYHRTVWKTIGGELKGPEKAWLKDATRAIK